MPWNVKWMLRSPRTITDGERDQLVALAAAEGARPWQVGRFGLGVLGGSGLVAGGGTVMPDDVSHGDWTMLLAALTRLRAVVTDATCEVTDDLALIVWDEATGHYQTAGWERPPAAAPAPPPPAAADGDPPSAEEVAVRDLFARIAAAGNATWDLRKQLDAFAAELVVRIGLALLPTAPRQDLMNGQWVRRELANSVRDAAARLRDVDLVEDAIAAAWDARPDDELADHVAAALEPIAAAPAVRGRAIRAVMDDATGPAQRTAAIKLLGAARAAGAEVAVVLIARARADREARAAAPWRGDLLAALARLRRRDCFPTLALAASDDPDELWRVVTELADADPDRALPLLVRMHGAVGVTKDSVARAIARVPDQAATDALIGMAEHPTAKVRALVAAGLLERRRLAEVAGIWVTLDAVGHEDYGRASVARALGDAHGDGAVDWDALVVARGLTPRTFAPVPAPLTVLLDADPYVRGEARNQLEQRLDLGDVIALARAAQVEAELGRRDQPRASTSWYRWREALAARGCTASADDDVIAWLLRHADELPPQATTAALDHLAAAGAAAVATELAGPRFALTADERAALDAEEAALAARAASLAPDDRGPPRPPGDDLFDGPPAEHDGPRLGEASDAATGLRTEPGGLRPSWWASDGVVDVLDGQVVGEVRPWSEHDVGLRFTAIIRRRTRWLRVDAFEVVIRDGDGHALRALETRHGGHLPDPARVGVADHLSRAAYAEARTADVRATVREPFQIRAGHWRVEPHATAVAGRVPLTAIAEPPIAALPGLTSPVRATATCHLTEVRDALEADLTLELAMVAPVFAVTPVQVAIAFRDPRGQLLDRTRLDVALPADGGTVVVRRLFAERTARADATIEVVVRGARTMLVPLAGFALDGVAPS